MSVKDNYNAYYTKLLNALKVDYPTLSAGTVYKNTPPKLPYFYFKQIHGTTALTTMSCTEDGINLAFQVDFYSKVSMAEVRGMAVLARRVMTEMGFQCNYFEQMDNTGDTSIYRWVTRFEKLET